jgi:hypothetical protein
VYEVVLTQAASKVGIFFEFFGRADRKPAAKSRICILPIVHTSRGVEQQAEIVCCAVKPA